MKDRKTEDPQSQDQPDLSIPIRTVVEKPANDTDPPADPNDTGPPAKPSYKSPLDRDWERARWARMYPYLAPALPGLLPFPAALSQLLNHPALRNADPATRERILAGESTCQYWITESLEAGPVDQVLRAVYAGLVMRLPPAAVVDAVKIRHDEAWHCLMSMLLRQDVERRYGLSPPRFQPVFVRFLEALVAEDVRLAFASVTALETMISAAFRLIPRDQEVQPAVRSYYRLHDADEARHSAYFQRLLRLAWGGWDRQTQRAMAAVMIRTAEIFFTPDEGALQAALASCPELPVSTIISDVMSEPLPLESMRKAARPLVGLMRRIAFADDQIVEAFRQAGLI